MARNYHQGLYEVKNKAKYIGTKAPTFRSAWEKVFMEWADRSNGVLRWGSEINSIEYFDPVQNKKRRYYPDFFLEYMTRDGEIKVEIIELKPFSQTSPPQKGRKKKETYLEEQATFCTNTAKWLAAEAYAKSKGIGFRIITERSLFR